MSSTLTTSVHAQNLIETVVNIADTVMLIATNSPSFILANWPAFFLLYYDMATGTSVFMSCLNDEDDRSPDARIIYICTDILCLAIPQQL